ncbi:MAG: UTP--glucose-1-phosphate uridylyltransferase [Verrucomicrobiales bacterium]
MSEKDVAPVDKMRSAGISVPSVAAFERAYRFLSSGERTDIPEDLIEPISDISDYGGLSAPEAALVEPLLEKTVIIKLNGGLGTGMGLQQAKSLLEIRGDLTFLDLIARQILAMRKRSGRTVRFLLMNSFSTSKDSLSLLSKYPDLGGSDGFEILQSRAPKIDAATLEAVSYPDNCQLEWCPPGHGDLYPALISSGWLDRLLERGVIYAFISNSDNLGATLDFKLLNTFADSEMPFMMEVTSRSEADKKGGHIARLRNGGRLLLRELGQCPESDIDAFQDVSRHRFFNTNNLWLRLDELKSRMEIAGGVLPLPVIVNRKTVDPRDLYSLPVIQLETAMGAAIECFEKAGVVAVPRSRFLPVKTCDDLFALRSDAYVMSEDWQLRLAPERNAPPPIVHLDKRHYKHIEHVELATSDGVPSLVKCERLEVNGQVRFEVDTVFSGCVNVRNTGSQEAVLPSGFYADETVVL